MDSVVTHDGILGVSIIRIYLKKSWGVVRGVQHTNRFSVGNRNGSWGRIRGMPGSFVRADTIISGNERDIKIWVPKSD